jgi:hypothetical protein
MGSSREPRAILTKSHMPYRIRTPSASAEQPARMPEKVCSILSASPMLSEPLWRLWLFPRSLGGAASKPLAAYGR